MTIMRKYALLRAKFMKLRLFSVITTILFGVMCISTLILISQNQKLNKELTTIKNEYNKQDKTISDLESVVTDLDTQLHQVADVNKTYVDELTEFRQRSELYDKYSYAIINESGKRTELKYEEIKYGEELMQAKGLNPHLMFGTIMVESGANPNAVNKKSGATGYGQFLNSTAKFVWTKLLNNESFDPNVMKDGKSNILMMAEYYEYLNSYKSGTFEIIKQYSGNSTDEGARNYLAKINRYTNKVGAVVK